MLVLPRRGGEVSGRIRWRNLGVFSFTFGCALMSAAYLKTNLGTMIVFYGFGVLGPWFIMRMERDS